MSGICLFPVPCRRTNSNATVSSALRNEVVSSLQSKQAKSLNEQTLRLFWDVKELSMGEVTLFTFFEA